MKNNSNISQELIEAIERYHKGTMNKKELKDFNDYLKIDPEFRIQVEDIKTMLLGIEAQSLKEQLDNFHDDIPNTIIKKPNNNKVRFLNYSKIAAAAAIIIAVGSIWFFSSSPNERLYAKYFKPDPGLPTTMSSTDNFDFYDAMVSYKHGDYQKAITKWQVIYEKQSNNDTINYFLGVAHLANKNIEDAIPFLEKTVQSQNAFPLINDAHYYLGLAYLNEGNRKLAKKHFSLSKTDIGKELVLKLTD